MAEVVNSTAIRLSWGEPSDPNGRVLSYHLVASVDPQDSYVMQTGLEGLNTTLGDGDLREATLTGLHPYVNYMFQLSAATSIGQGNPTVVKTAMTSQAGMCNLVNS